MKTLYIYLLVALVGITASCSLDPIENPNDPTKESLLNGATEQDLQLLLSGLESSLRTDMGFYFNTVSMVGREYYDLTGTDPRYTGELLGAQGAQLDNNGFLTTRGFAQAYQVARNASNFIEAVQNSQTSFSEAEKAALIGVAQTYMAYSLSLELNRQYENGIRVDVADADNLGPFLSYTESLAALKQILDDAGSKLNGASIPLVVQSDQFVGVDSFYQFNRAIAARIAMFQGDKSAMLSALNNSFMSDNPADFNNGFYYIFGLSGNDISNPLAVVPQVTNFVATNSWVNDAEAGDTRVDAKTIQLLNDDGTNKTVALNGLSGTKQIGLYTSLTEAVPMIRNEELVLMAAEANIGTNNGEALRLINIVRNAAGLPNSSASTDSALIDELLMQRRYSLFGEGHYWSDMRRFGRLSQIPIERSGDVVHQQFPRPVLETD